MLRASHATRSRPKGRGKNLAILTLKRNGKSDWTGCRILPLASYAGRPNDVPTLKGVHGRSELWRGSSRPASAQAARATLQQAPIRIIIAERFGLERTQ